MIYSRKISGNVTLMCILFDRVMFVVFRKGIYEFVLDLSTPRERYRFKKYLCFKESSIRAILKKLWNFENFMYRDRKPSQNGEYMNTF